jgi:hypothetical protein
MRVNRSLADSGSFGWKIFDPIWKRCLRIENKEDEAMNLVLPLPLLLALCADPLDLGVITETNGIALRACHASDSILVEIEPAHPSDHVVGGMFVTTNRTLTIRSAPMSMVPSGTNFARMSVICGGSTSAPVEVKFMIRRPVPPPQVGRVTVVAIPPLPLPSGLIPALPGGSRQDASYTAYRERLERAAREGRRRSQ